MEPMYLSIQPKKTGERIRKLLLEKGYTIREIQGAFGFENPQAIYKWLSGKSLPSIDNFIILSRLLHTSIEDILVIDGDISYYIGNFIFYIIKASGELHSNGAIRLHHLYCKQENSMGGKNHEENYISLCKQDVEKP